MSGPSPLDRARQRALTGTYVYEVRSALRFTQQQLADLIGVHPLTVSRWERGVLGLAPHNKGLLRAFRRAAKRDPAIGQKIVPLISVPGSPRTITGLWRLLDAGHPVLPNGANDGE